MPVSELGPPPDQGVVEQMQPQQGPFSLAQQRGQQPQQDMGNPEDPIEGQLIVVTIHMKQMLNSKPALAPWVNQAVNLLQTGVRTIMAQDRQQAGATNPVSSATPSSEPGGGLPV